ANPLSRLALRRATVGVDRAAPIAPRPRPGITVAAHPVAEDTLAAAEAEATMVGAAVHAAVVVELRAAAAVELHAAAAVPTVEAEGTERTSSIC
ncbi:MAG: hypothetical protein ACRD3T_19985, partial [Terriglobia bacterium]